MCHLYASNIIFALKALGLSTIDLNVYLVWILMALLAVVAGYEVVKGTGVLVLCVCYFEGAAVMHTCTCA